MKSSRRNGNSQSAHLDVTSNEVRDTGSNEHSNHRAAAAGTYLAEKVIVSGQPLGDSRVIGPETVSTNAAADWSATTDRGHISKSFHLAQWKELAEIEPGQKTFASHGHPTGEDSSVPGMVEKANKYSDVASTNMNEGRRAETSDDSSSTLEPVIGDKNNQASNAELAFQGRQLFGRFEGSEDVTFANPIVSLPAPSPQLLEAILNASSTNATNSNRTWASVTQGTFENHVALIGQNGGWGKTEIKYHFLTEIPAYYISEFPDEQINVGGQIVQLDTFQPFDSPEFLNSSQQAAVEKAFSDLELVFNITFVETSNVQESDITFGNLSWDDQGRVGQVGFAFFPDSDAPQPSTAGDVWMNALSFGNLDPLNIVAAFQSLLHEIGHALGLEHPFEGTAVLPPEENEYRYTVMSYTDRFPKSQLFSPQEFMLYDIAALENLGYSRKFYDPTDEYVWNTLEFSDLIVDDGGTDTINIRNQIRPAIVDLRQGALSSIGATNIPPFPSGLPPDTFGIDDVIEKPLGNVSIAFGTVIENIEGSDQEDLLIGNAQSNVIRGYGGDDRIYGDGIRYDGNPGFGAPENGGDSIDELYGGEGNDLIIGGDDDVIIQGDAGSDVINSGEGNDSLFGGADNDTIKGGAGTDTLHGDGGEDRLFGGADNDTLEGGSEDDELAGGSGDDTLDGGAGADKLFGGAGNDSLTGGTDDGVPDTLDGGLDADRYKVGDGDRVVVDEDDVSITLLEEQITGGEVEYVSSFFLQGTVFGDFEAGLYKSTGDDETLYYLFANEPPEPEPSEPPADSPPVGMATAASAEQEPMTIDMVVELKTGERVLVNNFTNGYAGIKLELKENDDTDQDNSEEDQEGAEGKLSPLTLDLDGDGIELVDLSASSAFFDFDSDGFAERTGWVASDDGLLAVDRDGDGLITGLDELFGTNPPSVYGEIDATTPIESGFVKLGEFDSNADGKIDALDTDFGSLRVWRDLDGDGVGTEDEQFTLAELGIASIGLDFTRPAQQVGENMIFDVGQFVWNDMTTGTVADVFFAFDQSFTIERTGDLVIPDEVKALPKILGFGSVSDLDVAMARDPLLKEMVEELVALTPDRAHELTGRVESIILRWHGVDDVAADGRGSYVNGQWLAAMEALNGKGFAQGRFDSPNPFPQAGAIMTESWRDHVADMSAKLLAQIPLGETIAPGLNYVGTAFLTRDTDATLATVLSAMQANSPTDEAENLQYWQGMARVLSVYRRFFPETNQAFAAAITAVLVQEGIDLSYDLIRPSLFGGDGDDVLVGTSSGLTGFFASPGRGQDVLMGAEGDDRLIGGRGADTYLFGRGHGKDVIEDRAEGNVVEFLAGIVPADVTYRLEVIGPTVDLVVSIAGTGDELRIVGEGLDSRGIIDRFRFADGTELAFNEIGLDTGTGTAGDDQLPALAGVDTELDGGAGNDVLAGNTGNDTYRFDAGYGDDLIIERRSDVASTDQIIFGAGIDPATIQFSRSSDPEGRDLVISFAGLTDTLTIANQFAFALRPIESLQFDQDPLSPLSAADIEALLTASTSGDDRILGTIGDDSLSGGDGNDTLLGLTGADSLDGGLGDDRLEGFGGADTLTGGAGNDILVGGAAADILDGGDDQDILRGGDGNDDLTGGAGDDQLRGEDGNDQLDGGAGADEIFGGAGNDTLLGGTGDDLLGDSDGVNVLDGGEGDDVIRGSGTLIGGVGDDSLRGSSQIDSLDGGDGDDVLVGFFGDDTLVGGDGNDRLFGGSSDDSLDGGTGNDELFGGSGADNLDGGAGDDLLDGGGGADTYFYGTGFGRDRIEDDAEAANILKLGPGIAVSDLTVLRSGVGLRNVLIQLPGEGDVLEILDQSVADTISRVDFQDDPTASITGQELLALATPIPGDALIGTFGDDTLIGDATDNVLDGGAGNDSLQGDLGNDTYIFGRGYGSDRISDSGGALDVVEFLPGVTLDDLQFSSFDGLGNLHIGDLIVHIEGTDDELRIIDGATPGSLRTIEEFRFSDLSTVPLASIVPGLQTGTAGDDELYVVGTSPGTFAPGQGDDIMRGSPLSNDRYTFGPNFGTDTIIEADGFGDRVVFEVGIARSDVVLSYIGRDLVADVVSTGDRLIVKDQFLPPDSNDRRPIEFIEFLQDSLVLTEAEFRAEALAATAGDDLMIAIGTETLDGQAGNDRLEGDSGSTTYVFGRDYDQDVIVDLSRFGDPDTVAFGPGIALSDLVIRRDGDFGTGLSIEIAGTDDVLTIAVDNQGFGRIETFTLNGGMEVFSGTDFEAIAAAAEVTDGDDRITAFASEALLDGGAGDDVYVAGRSRSVIAFGDGAGKDTLSLSGFYDGLGYAQSTLEVGGGLTADDLDFRFLRGTVDGVFGDHLQILLNGGEDQLTVMDQYGSDFRFFDVGPLLNRIRFDDGTVLDFFEFGERASAPRVATDGDDYLFAANEFEVLNGGAGNDTLVWAFDGVTVEFGRGSGHDRIMLTGEDPGSAAILSFTGSLTRDDLSTAWIGEDLVFKIVDTGETVTLVDAVRTEPVEIVRFASGPDILVVDLKAELLLGTAGDDTLVSDWRGEVLDGGTGNDVLIGNEGPDTYVFGADYGNDTIVETLPSERMALFYGDYGSERLAEIDIVQFAPGITVDDVTLTATGDEFFDLLVTLNATGDTLLIEGQLAPQQYDAGVREGPAADPNSPFGLVPAGVDEFHFGSTVLTREEIADRVSDTDLAGDNTIETGDGGGVLDGGGGQDMLMGGTGNDTYIFDRGYSEDQIVDAGGSFDTIRFGAETFVGDVKFSRAGADGGDLLIEVGGTERLTLTVDNQFSNPDNRIEFFEFEDGTVLGWPDVQDSVLRDLSTAGDDTIVGFDSDDMIDGGDGADTLQGGGGNDTLVGGDGRDAAVFSGAAADYTVDIQSDRVVVTDLRTDGDGRDTLFGIEDLSFLGDGSVTNLIPVNQAPLAVADAAAATEDAVVTIPLATLLQNDSDPEGQSLTLIEVNNPVNGTVWITLAGDVAFQPDADFFGAASFDYVIADPDGATATATVAVTVANVNDTPVADNAAVETAEDTPLNGVVTATDLDPDTLTFTLATPPVNGAVTLDSLTGAYTYTPDANFFGADSFVVTVDDGNGGSAQATIDVTVTSVNDLPVAASAAVTTAENTAVSGTISASDVETAALSYFVASFAANGNVDVDETTGAFTYTPFAGFVGSDSFDVIVLDADGGTDVSTITVTVEPGNAAPTDILLSNATVEENSEAGTVVGVLSAVDPDAGDTAAFTLLDDAGGRFEIVGDELRVANGLLLDFETAASHDVTVRVTDSDGLTYDETITIALIDLNETATAGDDTIYGTPGNDVIDGLDGNDTIFGRSGNDTLNGGAGNDVLDGGAGDDLVQGQDGDDVLIGGTGDDSLIGGSGSDRYQFDTGFGIDQISEFTVTTEIDAIEFAAGIAPTDVALLRASNKDLFVALGADQVKVIGQFDIVNPNFGIDEIRFADSTVWDRATILEMVLTGTEGDDNILGFDGDDTIRGLGGNDVLNGLAGNDTLIGGDGNDSLSGFTGNDNLDGGAGDDTLQGYTGTDTLDGGAGDDFLSGGTDADTYIFGLGYGSDTVSDFDTAANVIDVVDLTGVDASTVTLSRTGTYNVQVALAGGLDLLTLGGQLNTPSSGIEEIRFAGGVVWDRAAIDAMFAPVGTDGNDTLIGFGVGDTIDGGLGDDTIEGLDGDDTLIGGAGNDDLNGGNGNDRLDGGTGDDQLNGRSGSDTYVFGIGYGADNILDTSTAAGDIDVLEFGAGIAPSDIVLSRIGTGLVLAVGGAGDSVTLSSQFFSDTHGVEEIRFNDGTIWDQATINAMAAVGTAADETINGTVYNDTLSGEGGNDIIDGLAGNDTLFGGAGDDTLLGGLGVDTLIGGLGNDTLRGGNDNDFYVFDIGDGADNIFDQRSDGGPGAYDILQFGAGFAPADLQFSESGDNLIINFANSTDSITIIEQFDWWRWFTVEEFAFSDGARWVWQTGSNTTRYRLTMEGTADADSFVGYRDSDTIFGFGGDDSLSGALGNDTIHGGDGNDTLIGGDGNDVLNGDDGGDLLQGGAGADTLDGGLGTDTLEGGDGNDVLKAGSGPDILDGGAGTDTIDLSGATVGWTVDLVAGTFVETGTGVTGTMASVEDAVGGAGDDVVLGTSSDNSLAGGAGNDSLTGAAGSDTIDGGAGVDSAAFAGNRSDYRIVISNGVVTVTDLAPTVDGDDGVDTLTGIENLVFADRTVVVDGSNLGPVTQDSILITQRDLTASGQLSATDPEQDPAGLSFELFRDPAHGSVTVNADGTFTYVPEAGFASLDSFDFRVMDPGGLAEIGTVDLSVRSDTMATPIAIVNNTPRSDTTASAGYGWQVQPDITALADGGYVVAWSQSGIDNSSRAVLFQRFDVWGNEVGPQSRINTYTAKAQTEVGIASLPDGGFIAAWSSDDQARFWSREDVYFQRFDAAGNKVGGETRANVTINQKQGLPKVDVFSDGGFVVTWESWAQDGNNFGTYARIFAADGSAVTNEFLVNTYTANNQNWQSVEVLNNGTFVVTWQSTGQDGSGVGIYGQRFAADGTRLGGEFQVATQTLGNQSNARMAALTDGGFLIVWVDASGAFAGSDGTEIAARRYDANGTALGPEFHINVDNAVGNQYTPAVAALPDGGYVVIWSDVDGTLRGQRYDQNDAQSGAQFTVQSFAFNEGGGLWHPAVTSLDDGGFAVTWQASETPGGVTNVFTVSYPGDSVNTLDGGDGNDVLIGGAAAETLNGGLGDDELQGGGGDDALRGDAGDDRLIGGDGADTLTGGAGDDVLTGDAGSDTFVFATGSGADTVQDFVAGMATDDVLDVGGLGYATAAEILADAVQSGVDTVITTAGGDSITLVGVNVGSLHEDDFLFV